MPQEKKEPGVRVTINSTLHKKLKSEAALAGMSLRALAEEVIEDGLFTKQIRDGRR